MKTTAKSAVKVVAAIFSVAMLQMAAHGALWIGGAGGDFNSSANWSSDDGSTGDFGTSALNFTNDCTVTLSADAVIYRPWGSKRDASGYVDNSICFDMGGHTLWATNGITQWCSGNVRNTYTFRNGTFRNTNGTGEHSPTNILENNDGTGMSFIVTGDETTFISSAKILGNNSFRLLDGARVYGRCFLFGGVKGNGIPMSSEISGGSTLCFDEYCDVGNYWHDTSLEDGRHDALLVVDNATLTSADPASSGDIDVGYFRGSYDNVLIATNGAQIAAKDLHIGQQNGTNNMFKATGAGTTVNFSGVVWIGAWAATAMPVSNSFVLEDGATATIGGVLHANGVGSNNMVSVRSGASLTLNDNATLGFIDKRTSHYGRCGRLEVVGENSRLSSADGMYLCIGNFTGDNSQASELFVGDGGRVDVPSLFFFGKGGRLVVSNGTVNLTRVYANGGPAGVWCAGTNTTIRIEGSSAKFTSGSSWEWKYGSGIRTGNLAGAPIFEFVIPEGGWSSAPVVINEAFAISDDTTIGIDGDSARAYAEKGGGTVPLFSTGSSSRLITADLSKIGADLPEGCALVNKSGVLSVRISKPGLVLVVK